jgi:DNA-binding Lrp family transcriptional regulator
LSPFLEILERRTTMESWWSEIDHDVQRCLERDGTMTPAEIGRQLGLSESAVGSILSMLAHEGKLRIARVELTPGHDGRQLSF